MKTGFSCLVSVLPAPALVAALLFAVSGPAFAKEPPYSSGAVPGVAIDGYDPVAYFKSRQPVKGLASMALTFEGAEWRFASAANREAFRAAPRKYTPQFGGYCAYAVAKNGLAAGDPQQWDIVGGKLYLNYDADVRQRWNAGRAGYIRDAKQNWPHVLGQ